MALHSFSNICRNLIHSFSVVFIPTFLTFIPIFFLPSANNKKFEIKKKKKILILDEIAHLLKEELAFKASKNRCRSTRVFSEQDFFQFAYIITRKIID